MTVTIETDLCYPDDLDTAAGDDAVRQIVRIHGGLVTYFQLRGPGGGNPNYVFELPDLDRAKQFWEELDVGTDLADHLRKNGAGDYQYGGS